MQAVWKKSWPKASLTCSVLLVVVGCVIAGVGDLAFDAGAYAFAFSSVITQALYLLLVEFQVRGRGGASLVRGLMGCHECIILVVLYACCVFVRMLVVECAWSGAAALSYRAVSALSALSL